MQVASLTLCKELYKLSGWETESYQCDFGKGFVVTENFNKTQILKKQQYKLGAPLIVTPLYDLGYLLQKLPYSWQLEYELREYYCSMEGYSAKGDTAQNTVCKLLIMLFKERILQ